MENKPTQKKNYINTDHYFRGAIFGGILFFALSGILIDLYKEGFLFTPFREGYNVVLFGLHLIYFSVTGCIVFFFWFRFFKFPKTITKVETNVAGILLKKLIKIGEEKSGETQITGLSLLGENDKVLGVVDSSLSEFPNLILEIENQIKKTQEPPYWETQNKIEEPKGRFKVILIYGVIFLLTSYALFYSGKALFKEYEINQSEILIEGQITDASKSYGTSHVSYSFTTNTGEEKKDIAFVSEETLGKLKKGDIIQIKYLENEPEWNKPYFEPIKENSKWEISNENITRFIFIFFWTGISFFIFYNNLSKNWKTSKFVDIYLKPFKENPVSEENHQPKSL